MTLQLPAFEGRKCLTLSVCCIFGKEKEPKVEIPEVEERLIAKYRSGSRTIFLRLVLPFPAFNDDRHVHLELTTGDLFPKGKAPKPNAEVQKILDLVQPFIGTRVNMEIDATFHVPPSSLIPVIRSAVATEAGSGNIRVKMTGGTFSIQGAPVETLAWKLLETTGVVEVTLRARKKGSLEDSYLNSALDLVESTFEVFTVDEAANV
jgi:hypothetical protein